MKGWYNLPLTKNECKLIYRKLDWADWAIIRTAHNEQWFNENIRHRLSVIYSIKGNLEMLKWSTKELNYDIDYLLDMLEVAAEHGHIHILSYLKKLINVEKWTSPLYEAIWKGQLDVVKWVIKQGGQLDYVLCDLIIEQNQMEICKWVIDYHANFIIDEEEVQNLITWYEGVLQSTSHQG